ncbi:uncharacterized protein LOC110455941 [Mizuhopecten yessoensis]|uniref:Uncharacterized protein n=1 Tax=Mizuhopecten yessoensis TaxID=6573 RepID=A0A210QC44_MIZYE|nr:uncharacterized protein LOC110455941 [Mizuhopecten yessoensis]OWF46289.1 hypothetical protein KP79_PYT01445 [Mizuhopecten yessoensis]
MEMSTSNEVKLTLCLRNGQQVEFVKPCAATNGGVDFVTLHKVLCSVQQESNAFLTTIVEEEKASSGSTTLKANVGETEDEEEDEEDEEDGSGDASLNGPVEKKQKILS